MTGNRGQCRIFPFLRLVCPAGGGAISCLDFCAIALISRQLAAAPPAGYTGTYLRMQPMGPSNKTKRVSLLHSHPEGGMSNMSVCWLALLRCGRTGALRTMWCLGQRMRTQRQPAAAGQESAFLAWSQRWSAAMTSSCRCVVSVQPLAPRHHI